MDLLVIGDKLLDKKRLAESIETLKLLLQEFPDGTYAYYTHYDLARAYQDSGDVPQAIASCQTALELRPEFQAAKNLLEELQQ